eukprot:7388663-Prymnesium_polylepis.1
MLAVQSANVGVVEADMPSQFSIPVPQERTRPPPLSANTPQHSVFRKVLGLAAGSSIPDALICDP